MSEDQSSAIQLFIISFHSERRFDFLYVLDGKIHLDIWIVCCKPHNLLDNHYNCNQIGNDDYIFGGANDDDNCDDDNTHDDDVIDQSPSLL